MSVLIKSAAVAFVIVVVWTIYDLFRGIALTGSGGLGAVSVGPTEALIELVAFTAVIWLVLYLKSKIKRPRRPATR